MTNSNEDGKCCITRPAVSYIDGKFPKCIYDFGHKGPHSWENHSDTYSITSYTWPVSKIESTVCKHHRGQCDVCGTSDLRDTIHTTENGVGKVGKLSK
jgi:hypothetical protein